VVGGGRKSGRRGTGTACRESRRSRSWYHDPYRSETRRCRVSETLHGSPSHPLSPQPRLSPRMDRVDWLPCTDGATPRHHKADTRT